MPADYCLVLCTCPDAGTARELANALVENRKAACVNILPGLISVYGWKGQVESADEWLLLIKTASAGFDDLEAFIKARHPYEVPEIIAIPMVRGSMAYLDWMKTWLKRGG